MSGGGVSGDGVGEASDDCWVAKDSEASDNSFSAGTKERAMFDTSKGEEEGEEEASSFAGGGGVSDAASGVDSASAAVGEGDWTSSFESSENGSALSPAAVSFTNLAYDPDAGAQQLSAQFGKQA